MLSPSSDNEQLELRTKAFGYELYSHIEKKAPSVFKAQWWENQILEWCMRNDALRTQLLRFVDVFPSLRSPRMLVSHLRQYFPRSERAFPAFLRLGIDLSSPAPITRSILSRETRVMVMRMARKFIAGATIDESFDVLRETRSHGMTFTLDLLGEAVVSELEAERYKEGYIRALRELSTRWSELEGETRTGDRPNISLKLSSLYSRFDPLSEAATKAAVKRRLREIFVEARELGAFVNVDMEQYEYCQITLRIFSELLLEEDFRDFPNAGIVIQAYLRESGRMLEQLLEWVRQREVPVTVRLVKGAYWDYEVIHARQMGWPPPVFMSKQETDANFERLSRVLLEHHPRVRTAIGSHNIRSIARAVACAESVGLRPADLEFQMLYGMGDSIKKAILKTEYPLRVYTPFGELLPGIAYLVRRILENTSNESFLRQDYFMESSPDELLRQPLKPAPTEPEGGAVAAKSPSRGARFRNEPTLDFSREEARRDMARALEETGARLGESYPIVIGGEKIETTNVAVSINPSHKNQVVGVVSQATVEHAEQALAKARSVFETWGATGPEQRAEFLLRAADIMARKRLQLAALQVYEVGKSWREADADVAEAVDYLRYYASEMVRLGSISLTERLPGERNEYVYRPRGVGVVIAPWNFPLAILTGMSSAAAVTGNCVIMKPAAQSAVIAAHLMEIYEEAGLPAGVVNLLPGRGETVGEHLVKSAEVDFIAFTGSQEVGTRINRLAAENPSRRGIKRVVAEMGGKNAVIVDETADLDEAITGIVASAFGYQGQKCSAASRVIALENIFDALLARMVEAAKSLKVGPSEDPSSDVGPVIDEAALGKIIRYIEIGKRDCRVALETDVSGLKDGYYVGPTIFTDVAPESTLAQEEIFGPVVVLLKAKNFDDALRIANDTQYGLTGGVYSRTPANIEAARHHFNVGNLYINRKITGAIVQRQPFGGFKMSGIGSKAGGPDYLVQFLLPQTVTENVMRHGFAPLK